MSSDAMNLGSVEYWWRRIFELLFSWHHNCVLAIAFYCFQACFSGTALML